MRYKDLLLGMCVLLLSHAMDAQQLSNTKGNSLLEQCESKEAFKQGLCVGFITGVMDVESMQRALYPERGRWCVPENVTSNQLRDIVVKYLREHPREMRAEGAIVVISALRNEFRCKS